MATATTDRRQPDSNSGGIANVWRWWLFANEASHKYNIPTSTILGIVHEESRGEEGKTSSAGAGGLTQFMPGTAKNYGVDVSPGHPRSQIEGTAKYLKDLGYAENPREALASYAAGPNNKAAGYSYADRILNFTSKLYKGMPPDKDALELDSGREVGDVGNVAGDVAGGVASGVSDAFSLFSNIWKKISSGDFWLSVGKILMGVIALVLGIRFIGKNFGV